MDIALKQKRFKLGSQIAYGAVIALVVSPIIYFIIKGIVGLITAVVIGGSAMALLPAFSTWLTNLKFKAVRYVVEKDPSTTLDAVQDERARGLEELRVQLESQIAGVEKFRTYAQQTSKDYPEEAPAMQERLQEHEQVLAYRIDEYKESKETFEKLKHTIAKAKRMYELAMLDEATSKSLGTGNDLMTRFKQEVALEAIDSASAKSMARLRMAMVDQQFAAEQVKGREIRAINYKSNGQMELGNILQPIEVKVINA